MKQIISNAKIKVMAPEIHNCPICGSEDTHYSLRPKLELRIDFDDIEQKLAELEAREFHIPSGDVIQIILKIGHTGDRIFGHPVKYEGVGDG